jgi:hypothetical protein
LAYAESFQYRFLANTVPENKLFREGPRTLVDLKLTINPTRLVQSIIDGVYQDGEALISLDHLREMIDEEIGLKLAKLMKPLMARDSTAQLIIHHITEMTSYNPSFYTATCGTSVRDREASVSSEMNIEEKSCEQDALAGYQLLESADHETGMTSLRADAPAARKSQGNKKTRKFNRKLEKTQDKPSISQVKMKTEQVENKVLQVLLRSESVREVRKLRKKTSATSTQLLQEKPLENVASEELAKVTKAQPKAILIESRVSQTDPTTIAQAPGAVSALSAIKCTPTPVSGHLQTTSLELRAKDDRSKCDKSSHPETASHDAYESRHVPTDKVHVNLDSSYDEHYHPVIHSAGNNYHNVKSGYTPAISHDPRVRVYLYYGKVLICLFNIFTVLLPN